MSNRAFRRNRLHLPASLAKFAPAFLAAGSFSPTNPSGLQRWWDANTIATLYQDSAKTTPVTAADDPVGNWVSRVGATGAYQTTTTKRPLYKSGGPNSKYYLLSDGVDDYLFLDDELALTNFTILWVGTFELFDSSRALWGDNDLGFLRSIAIANTLVYRSHTDVSAATLTNNASIAGNFYIFALRRNGTTLELFRDGAIGTTSPSYTIDTHAHTVRVLFSLRTSIHFNNCKMCEWLFYNRSLSNDERGIVEAYLSDRYDISI